MTLSMAIFTYINAWWISLFLVRPFYMTPVIRWKKMIIATTIFAALATSALALMIKYEIVPLHSLQQG